MSAKDHILTILEKNRGESVSGEHMAQTLKISRNAVWKAVNDLKKDGYKIEAIPNKGYCLCEENDILSVQGIIPFLTQKEAANNITVYPSLASTNKTAKELALAEASHGTIVISDTQTAGKGRYNRSFYSPPGSGIYMSFVLHPNQLSLDTPTLITAFAAVAVCKAINKITQKSPKVKWVNDIYWDGKKVCGILTEAITDFESGKIQWVVIGIGINVYTPKEAFPNELSPIAGSLFQSEKRTITRNQLAAQIINHILDSTQYHKDQILKDYKSLLFMLNQKIQVVTSQSTYEAWAMDIDPMGRLIIKIEDKEIRTLSSGEIHILH